MRRNVHIALIFALSVLSLPLSGVEKPYVTGKVLDVEQKSRDKVDMYLVNTPVLTAVPYFQISVEFGNIRYVAEYQPRHSAEELPESWRAGADVQGRVEKHYLYLQRPEGSEVKWIITRKIPISKASSND